MSKKAKRSNIAYLEEERMVRVFDDWCNWDGEYVKVVAHFRYDEGDGMRVPQGDVWINVFGMDDDMMSYDCTLKGADVDIDKVRCRYRNALYFMRYKIPPIASHKWFEGKGFIYG